MTAAEAHGDPLNPILDKVMGTTNLKHFATSNETSLLKRNASRLLEHVTTGGLPGICFTRNKSLREKIDSKFTLKPY